MQKVEGNRTNSFLLQFSNESNQNSQHEIENKKVGIEPILAAKTISYMDRVTDLASKKAAVIFTKSSCCMCHSIKALFYELGASPAIHEVDHDADMEWALRRLGCNPAIPAVFIGGKYVGSARDVISLHVDGSLKQKLIEARAIWF